MEAHGIGREVGRRRIRFGFSRAERIKRSEDIRRITRTGKRSSRGGYRIYFKPNGLPCSRLGIIVGKMESAVRRNREKRICREFFRKEKGRLREAMDIVVAIDSEHGDDRALAALFQKSGVLTGS